MKILWVVNIIFPDLCFDLGLKSPVVGGWMYDSAKALVQRNNVELIVVTTHKSPKLFTKKINNITYWLIPSKDNNSYNPNLERHWNTVLQEERPDVVHIHGTEYSHGLAAMEVFDNHKFLISIQGLVSIYSKYFLADINRGDINRNVTLRDLIRGNLYKDQKNFAKKGLLEKKYIQKTSHVMGRTSWDYAHTKAINSKTYYHFCNETLRSTFYSADKWNIGNKNNFQIFLSQAGYPIKGLHKVISALSLIKEEFPELQLRIGGANIINFGSPIKDKMRISGYGKYIRSLIKKTKLENNITFLGMLDEKEMIYEYQKAHIFICPSSIENSPNSVGEAQIIGTPTIASFVGGIPDMIKQNETGILYRFEEMDMLAMYVKQLFNNNEQCIYLSENSILAAEKRHDVKTIIDSMIKSYETIFNKRGYR